MNKQNTKKILAHRGYSGIAPENTALSFSAAVLFGFNGFELDVHLTKDNQLVVIHDETTNRTSLVAKKVQNATLKELKELDMGAFFKVKCPKQTILTLKELLDLYLDQIEFLNIEIKTDIIAYKGIEQLLNDLVSKYKNAYEKIIFSSFNFDSLLKLYEINNRWKIGFLWWTQTQFLKVDPKILKKVCVYLHPWTKIYEQRKNEYLKLKMPFNLWTIASQDKFDLFSKDKNVEFLISNYKY